MVIDSLATIITKKYIILVCPSEFIIKYTESVTNGVI